MIESLRVPDGFHVKGAESWYVQYEDGTERGSKDELGFLHGPSRNPKPDDQTE